LEKCSHFPNQTQKALQIASEHSSICKKVQQRPSQSLYERLALQAMNDQGINSDSKFGDSSEFLPVWSGHRLSLKISVPKIRFANLEIAQNRLETFCLSDNEELRD
jgi:hypothetical protein